MTHYELQSESWRRWLFPVGSLALAVAIGLLFGLSFWTLFLIAIVLACPVVMVWTYVTYVMGQRPLPVPLGPVPETRGISLNWLAPWYDLVCSAFGLGKRFRDRTLAFAELQLGDHVLDVGCGTGVLTRRAADAVGPLGVVWGIDPAPDMIRIAMQAAGSTGNAAHFKLAAIEALPFDSSSFDAVLASAVIHHLPPDLKLIGLREVHRILKPGGRLLVVDVDRPSHWLWRIVFWPMRFHSTMGDHLHGRTSEVLHNAGFGDVTTLGRWGGLLTFWSARKPFRGMRKS
jgi:SAM-dependent methyltransferase